MSYSNFLFRFVLAGLLLAAGHYLGAQSIRLQAEITQFRSNYTSGDYRGPDIAWKWDGTVSVDGISRALDSGCFYKANQARTALTFNSTRTLINETIALPSGNGSRGSLNLCEDIVFVVNLKNWENDRGGDCTYNTNGGIFDNDDDGYRSTKLTVSIFAVDAGQWYSTSVNQSGNLYGYNIRFRYVITNPISSLTSNAANVVCDQSTVRLTANRGNDFEGGRYRFERRIGSGNWFYLYQGSRNYVNISAANIPNSTFRVSSVSADGCLGEDNLYRTWPPSGTNIQVVPSFDGSIPVTTQGACPGSSGGSLTYTGEELGTGVRVRLSVDKYVNGQYVSAAQAVDIDDTASHTFSGLSSGTYRINASVLAPGNGGVIANCTSSRSNISVSVLNQPLVNSVTSSSPLCGGTTGSVAIQVNRNGVGNVQYTLVEAGSGNTVEQSPGFSSANAYNFTGVAPGAYAVRVTGANGCATTSGPVTINDVPAPASGTITVLSQEAPNFDIACPGGTVPVRVTAPAGQGAYQVQRLPDGATLMLSAGASGFFSTSEGTYTFVFTRLNTGCVFSDIRAITENPTAPGVALSDPVEPTACMGSAGSLTATITDGVPPYTFKITPGPAEITQSDPVYTFTMLMGGIYQVEVTDARGCLAETGTFLPAASSIAFTPSPTEVTCFGGNDGSIQLSATGGTAPLEYKVMEVSNVYSNQTSYPGLPAGTYTAAVRDGDGCEEMREIVVREPLPIEITEITSDPILCLGNTTYLRITVSGREVCATAQDGAPAAINFFTISTDGGNNFLSPENYVLAGACADEITLLVTVPAGNYDVQVKDYENCISNIVSFNQADFLEPDELTLTIDEVTNLSCFEANDGTITVSYSGGIPYYNIVVVRLQPNISDTPDLVATSGFLSETSGTYTFGNLPASEGPFYGYGVFIIDNQLPPGSFFTGPSGSGPSAESSSFPPVNDGCRVEIFTRIAVTQPEELVIQEIQQTGPDVECDGSGGEITVTNVTGGVPPYTYSLSEGGFESSNVLSPESGYAMVYVQDANGCISSSGLGQTYAESDFDAVPEVTVLPAGCRPGQITVTLSGGDGPFTVELLVDEATLVETQFSDGEPVVFNDLDGSFYGISAYDSFGCGVFEFFPFPHLPELSVTTTNRTNENCLDALDGSLSVEVSGGVPPYTIVYNGTPTVGPTRTVTGIGADYHSFVIIDDFGCSYIHTDSIELLTRLELNTIVTGTGPCLDSETGVLEVFPVGGTPPYQIEWQDDPAFNVTLNAGQSTTRSNLASIEYTIQVTDGNGCSQLIDKYVEGPDSITVEVINLVQPDCDQAGSFDLDIQGGTAPYQISLNGAAPVTTTSFSGLPDGDYVFAVTDDNGCELLITDVSVTILSVGSITASATTTDVGCNGHADGTITINAVGGGAGAMYSLDGNVPQASNVFTGLAPGTYSVEVTSGSCATTVMDILIEEPAPLVITPTADVDECTGEASITLAATGGTGGYTFAVEANTVNPLVPFIGVPGGFYEVQVMDENGCVTTTDVVVPDFDPITITAEDVVDARCEDGTGQAAVVVSGGTAPYGFVWSNGGPTDSLFTNAGAGDYTVTVTDALGCVLTSQTITVGLVEGVTATNTPTDANCGAADGSITVNAFGGSGTYSYTWEAGVTAVDNQATGLVAGSYAYTVTDDVTGCTAEGMATIGGIGGATISLEQQTPAGCAIFATASATISATGGVPPYNYLWSSGETDPVATNLVAGSNSVTVTDDDGCSTILEVIIAQAPSPTLSPVSQTEAGCNAASLATATVAGAGGTGTLTYAWSDGQTGSTASGLIAGVYTVTVTDDLACTDELSITILQASDPVLSLDSRTEAGCGAQNPATATVSASGGRAPYSFLWSNGETDPTALLLTAGDHTVAVTDALGCTDEITVTIVQAPSPVLSLVSQSTAGCTPATLATAVVSATGGTAPLSYAWSSGDTGPVASGLPAGDYTVIVTDSRGCTDELLVSISQAPDPVVSISNQTVADCGPGEVATATATGGGGTAPYTYAWSNGETAATATNLAPGENTVTVTDAFGCSTETTVTIEQVTVPTVVITDVDCFGEATGSIDLAAPGLAAGAMFSLSGGPTQSGLNFSDLSAATYSIEVMATNCSVELTDLVVGTPPPLSLHPETIPEPCSGVSTITLTGGGGTPPYLYSFDGGPLLQTNTFSGSPGITYQIVVEDGNGCNLTEAVTVPSFTPLTISFSEVVEAQCADGTGEAAVAITGGTFPYSFDWSDGSTDSLLVGADAGIYTVTVTDVNGCVVESAPLTVELINVITTVATPVDATCGLSDGSVSLSSSGGSGSYSYTWPAGVTAGGNVAIELASGTYAYTVTDLGTGCQAFGQVAIQGAGGPTLSLQNQTAAGCTPATLATATVSTSDGQPPFNFTWSNGSTGPTGTNLAAGSNFVSITDANGCAGILEVVILQAPSPTISLISQTEAGCSVLGSATVSATGGTGAVSFAWSNGATGTTVTNLLAGDHSVTVTDALGCTDELMLTLIQSPDPTLTLEHQTIAGCTNMASATVSATGGTGDYTFAWSNGATSAMVTNLPSGNNTVTVTDARGCTDELTISIEEAPELMLSITNQTLAGCADLAFASATAAVNGGIPPYTYDWSNGETTETAVDLPPGANSVTITDALGCTEESILTVESVEGPLLDIVGQTDAGCGVFAFGSATVAPDGGTAPYEINWSSGETGLTANQLPASLNFVTLTDANHCMDVREIIIERTDGPDLTVLSQTTVDCGDQERATATVSASNGSPPYTFRWNTGATGATATNLRAGINTVTVTDGNSCTSELEVFIEQAGAPTLSLVSQTTLPCTPGSTATASVLATGGTPAYTYAWSSGATGPIATDLPAGPSTVTVTDASGCTDEFTVTIEQAESPGLTLESQTPAGCGAQSGGRAVVSALGGSPPYVFLWSNGEIGAEANNLSVGVNTVTVTDANDCTDEITVTIEQSPEPTLSLAHLVPANCTEGSGSITVLPGGGTGQFSYQWSHDAQLDGPEATELFSGNYGVTVTDELGCTAELTGLTIGFNAAPDLSLVTTTPSVCVANSGSITLTVSGGTAPLTYAWTGDVSSGLTGENLAPGEYGITVTDANGCTDEVAATVGGEGGIGLTVTSFTEATCGQSNGSISLAPSNGTAPYIFSWSHDTGLTGSIATNLAADTYMVTVSDASGCTAVVSQVIGDTPAVNLGAANITPTSCNQDAGAITAVATGGTGNLTYTWSHDATVTGPIITGLPAGSYALTVTDDAGCTASATYTVDNTDGPIFVSSDVSDALCTEGSGTISLVVANGLEPYVYAWSHDAGLTANSAINLSAGNYTVTVTDANGCAVEGNFSVDFLPAPGLSLAPTAPSCDAPNSGSILPTLTGGQSPFTYTWSDSSDEPLLENIPAGNYSLTVTDANGCMASASTVVEARSLPVITLESKQDIACTEVPGSASFLVTNLNGPASFTFSHPAATLTETDLGDGSVRVTVAGLMAGVYSLTVVSADGCTADGSVEIVTLPPFQLVVVNREPANCAGESSGRARVGIIGSAEMFTFQWDTAAGDQTGELASNLAAGTYSVTATSTNGCMATISVMIGEPAPLLPEEESGMNPSCFAASTGSITVSGSGGTPPYSYTWRGDTLPAFRTLTDLPAGEYQVTLTDANSCTDVLTVTLTDPTEILPEITVANSDCAGSATGSITVTPTGGTPPYTYHWPEFPAETGNTITGIAAGSYLLQVTDAANCTVTTTATVGEGSSPITITVAEQVEVSCPAAADGMISVLANGDNGPFTYQWSNGASGATVTGLAGGQSYVVTVTNALGCTENLTVSLEAGTDLEIIGIPADTSVCAGNIFALNLMDYPGATVSGPAGFTSMDEVALLEDAGTYVITYTSSAGCSATHVLTLSVTVATLTAQIVMASDIIIDQRLIVLEASFPAPDNVAWVIDESRVSLAAQEDNLYYFEFSEAGIYDIGMVADAGGCSDAVSKRVTVHADSTTIPGANLGALEILDLTVAPNPNMGQFSVSATLSNVQPFTLSLYRDNGELIDRRRTDNAASITENFALNLIPGTYFLQAQAGAERRMVAVIVQ